MDISAAIITSRCMLLAVVDIFSIIFINVAAAQPTSYLRQGKYCIHYETVDI
jgi:hypothetical protein